MDRRIGRGQFMLGDCLERMRELPDASVDMILCDLPYGTTQNKWDAVIPFEPLWTEYWRVAKPGAAVVLTAAQPFTSALVISQVKRFRDEWIWAKNAGTNFANAKRQPLREHESVLIFAKKATTYNPIGRPRLNPNIKRRSKIERGTNGHGFGLLDIEKFYGDGPKSPGTVLYFDVAPNSLGKIHPTQKPVALFEYLIRTYTDPDMTVLDNCAGSGTTAIAAERTGRNWICIERDPEYYAKACERVDTEIARKGLFA